MLTITDVRTAQFSGTTILTIGNFDGIHRGHRVLLQKLLDVAEQVEGPSKPQTGILTFRPHPLAVLRPNLMHRLLTTPEERLHLSAELGIDVGILQPFTPSFAQLSPRDFMTLLKEHLGLRGLVVGPDFAVGRNRAGDLPVLQALGEELDYNVHIIDPVEWEGKSVRSSNVRLLLTEGKVSEAADMLGRYYHVMGTVEVGDQRGREIGIPTANLRIHPEKLWPADGVYATRAWLQDKVVQQAHHSVTNIGVRPTVNGVKKRFETHILGFPAMGHGDNLYGQTIAVEFVARLRKEKRFANLDELVVQIRLDIERARQVLSSAEPVSRPSLFDL